MKVSTTNWRVKSVIACLILPSLVACEVLGYKTSSQSNTTASMHTGRVVNNANQTHSNNQQFDGQQHDGQDNPSNASDTTRNQPSGGTSAVNLSGQRHDCGRYMSGQTYYLQSPDGKRRLTRAKVGASGYGAPPKNFYPEGQRRLMTIRASKIDAYRALAEVVGGLHIWGGSAISDMVIERDRYHTFLDTYVRGAHVLTVSPMQDGTYKTDVEMEVDQSFLSRVMAFTDPSVDQHCLDQFTSHGKSSHVSYGANGVATNNFYYSE